MNTSISSIIGTVAERIDQHDVISFDIFDTAVWRPVAHPRHLFWLINGKAQDLLDDPTFDFYSERVAAEQTALKHKALQGGGEISLDEIYERLSGRSLISPLIAGQLKQIEQDMELQYCTTNPAISRIYSYAKERGKKIAFISDMYLPESLIRQILLKNGYEQFDHLIVSSSEGKTKRDGELYKVLLERSSTPASKILHIGDNRVSDILKAKRAGLHAHYIPNLINHFMANKSNRTAWDEFFPVNSVEKSVAIGLLAQNFWHSELEGPITTAGKQSSFGYQYLGTLYLGFGLWLHEKVKRSEINRLFFLSRDGKVIKQIFDTIAPHLESPVTSHYILASRRALIVALMGTSMNHAGLSYIFYHKGVKTLDELLQRIGLDALDFKHDIAQLGLAVSSPPNSLLAIQREGLLKAITPRLMENARKEMEALTNYYKRNGIEPGAENCGIVDIGWNGALAFSLMQLTGLSLKSTKVFFLGSYPRAKRLMTGNLDISGYLFEYGEPGLAFDIVRQNVELVELLFTAKEGSLIRFAEENGTLTPILDHDEISPDRIEFIQHSQNGALRFVEDFMSILGGEAGLRLPPDFAFKKIGAFIEKPTSEEVGLVQNISHSQHLPGGTDLRKFGSALSGWGILLNPKKFLADYKRQYWKGGVKAELGGWYYLFSITYMIYNALFCKHPASCHYGASKSRKWL